MVHIVKTFHRHAGPDDIRPICQLTCAFPITESVGAFSATRRSGAPRAYLPASVRDPPPSLNRPLPLPLPPPAATTMPRAATGAITAAFLRAQAPHMAPLASRIARAFPGLATAAATRFAPSSSASSPRLGLVPRLRSGASSAPSCTKTYGLRGRVSAARRNAAWLFPYLFLFQRAPSPAPVRLPLAARFLAPRRRRRASSCSRSSSSWARAPARASRASAASRTPPRFAPYAICPLASIHHLSILPNNIASSMLLFFLLSVACVILSCPACRFAPRRLSQGTRTGGATPLSFCATPPRLAPQTSLLMPASMCYDEHYNSALLHFFTDLSN